MISRLSGRVLASADGLWEVDVQGVAYSVRMGDRKAPVPGSELMLFTHLHQRDEGPSLFGFLTGEEKKIFLILLAVHGVGPKLAQSAVAALGPEGLARAILEKNLSQLTKIPGLGRKRAETLVQELGEKMEPFRVGAAAAPAVPEDEAAAGLTALGYGDEEVRGALARSGKGSTEERLRKAIQWLGGQR